MNNEKILSLLGLARRAGRVSLGHDAAIGSVVKNKAKLCVLSSDASERLKNEFLHAASYENKNIQYSAAKKIEYSGQEQQVTLFVPVDEYVGPGKYSAHIFVDGQMIGSGSLNIEK